MTSWRAAPVSADCALALADEGAGGSPRSWRGGGAHAVMVEIRGPSRVADGAYRALLGALGAFQAYLAREDLDPAAIQNLSELSARRAAGKQSIVLGTDLANLEGEPALASVLWRLGFRWVVMRALAEPATLEAAIAQRFALVVVVDVALGNLATSASPWIALARASSEITPDLTRMLAASGGVVHLAMRDGKGKQLESLLERVGEDHLALAPSAEVARSLKRLHDRPDAARKLLGGNLLRVLAARSGEVCS